ncbi:hypothetical protein AWB68_05613 [Caballeronia choica]|uniref:Uncharacterized protein n=1 Tax=Caballeronia choica TaxID=326476 RepID=A0A158KF36_9BURK|nr:hypothetical protein [Caballeronia choica]SAL79343.1 hypothetical protein AWB68_05613 [Caballeronia choica]
MQYAARRRVLSLYPNDWPDTCTLAWARVVALVARVQLVIGS